MDAKIVVLFEITLRVSLNLCEFYFKTGLSISTSTQIENQST